VKLILNDNNPGLPHSTRTLIHGMVSPLCGLARTLVFNLRARSGPRLIICGAELTGVHVLLNHPEPGSYHVGGGGVALQEAVIRALAETAERYSQFIAMLGNRHPVTVASYDEMSGRGHRILVAEKLHYFSEDQYALPGFPFQSFDPMRPMGWVKTRSLLDESELIVPAQLLLLGYEVNKQAGEPWLRSAVTTGTAVHTQPNQALRNALLELIQVDSLMGHWYSDGVAPEILLDQRTRLLEQLIGRYFAPQRPVIRFHWLGSPDLGAMTVACVVKNAPGQIPAGGVGVGSDLRLVPAMYRALNEAIGVLLLGKLNLVNQTLGHGTAQSDVARGDVDPWPAIPEEVVDEGASQLIFDLDTNVNFYARPENFSVVDKKFASECTVRASDLPPDSEAAVNQEIRQLVDGFRTTRKELIFLDLTSSDIGDLGLVSGRVWSPDTLDLCLPSAPPTRHPRFTVYGGITHRNPHPYP